MTKTIKLTPIKPEPVSAIKTLNLTPRGLTTTEGEQRVAKALKALEDSHATVANAATHFLRTYEHEIREALKRSGDDGAVEEFTELLMTIDDRSNVQDEFLRAIAGQPERAVR